MSQLSNECQKERPQALFSIGHDPNRAQTYDPWKAL
jgi:hypothetical protein